MSERYLRTTIMLRPDCAYGTDRCFSRPSLPLLMPASSAGRWRQSDGSCPAAPVCPCWLVVPASPDGWRRSDAARRARLPVSETNCFQLSWIDPLIRYLRGQLLAPHIGCCLLFGRCCWRVWRGSAVRQAMTGGPPDVRCRSLRYLIHQSSISSRVLLDHSAAAD
jgi:hypothetical protein